MYDSLLKHISSYSGIPLTSDECQLVQHAFLPRKLKRKQFFLQEGDICKYFGFILKGALRLYIVDKKGAEHTLQLAVEDSWIGDLESYVSFTPSRYYIDACEDAELLLLTREKHMELLDKIRTFEIMAKQMSVSRLIETERRVAASISLSAEERYAEFVELHPDLMQRFPLYIIASYLGITKETLSRIRK